MDQLYIGIMTGTSLDGADVALIRFTDERCAVLAFGHYDYPATLRADVLAMCQNQSTTIQKVGQLDYQLGAFFSDAILQCIETHAIDPSQVIAIGCHGQTVWHEPVGEYCFSTQLGNNSLVAARTQIDVVGDFRNADMAFGGQGAPLVPAFHDFLFNQGNQKRRVILNIGGIANISCLIPEEVVVGYDTGPGNMLLDAWIEKKKGLSYDKDAQWAVTGTTDLALLEQLLTDPWLQLAPPKSTGREYFNIAWLEAQLEQYQQRTQRAISDEDVQATLVDFTARSITDQLHRFQPEELIVCGGGALNPLLMQRLADLNTTTAVLSCEAFGIDAEALEATAFAWLAWCYTHRQAGNMSAVTGASQPVVLGALYPYTAKIG